MQENNNNKAQNSSFWVFPSPVSDILLKIHINNPGDSWEWPKYVSYQSENCRK